MKSETIKELMLYLYTSRFKLKIQESKNLEEFFSPNKIQALREEKNKCLDDVDIEVEEISNTEEQGDEPNSSDLINVDDDDASITAAPSQVRISGRKRKHVNDELYKRY
jgi:hypothetical protein